jgi:hypothetical protein
MSCLEIIDSLSCGAAGCRKDCAGADYCPQTGVSVLYIERRQFRREVINKVKCISRQQDQTIPAFFFIKKFGIYKRTYIFAPDILIN